MNLVVFGDSITWGAWDTKGGWVSRLKEFTDNKVISSNFQVYHSIYNLGISGDNSNTLLDRFETELKARIDEEEDNVVIVAIGTNDSQVNLQDNTTKVSVETLKSNISQLIKISTNSNVRILLVGLFPVDTEKLTPIPWKQGFAYNNEQIRIYDGILRDIADTNGVVFIDVLKEVEALEYKAMLIDGLHPNDKGHQLIFDIVKNNLVSNGLL